MAENQATVRVEVAKARGKGEDADEETRPDLSRAPIFADLEDDVKDELDHVIVSRLAPVREGELGRFEAEVTTEEIRTRLGGGKYQVQGRTKKGRPLKGGYATIEISGEPILQSKLARKQYAQMTGADEQREPTSSGGTSMPDILAMLERTRVTAETERERRATEEQARHDRELARLRAEAEIREKEREKDDERRQKLDDERRRRDKQDEEERDARRRRENEEQRQRDREWQATMAARAVPATDPTAMLIAGVNLAMKLGGAGGGGHEGPGDPITALAANLPATVEQLGKMFTKGAPAVAATAATDLTLSGPLGQKGQAVVKHLQAQGVDPEKALDHVLSQLLTVKATPQPAQQPGAAPPARRMGPGGRAMPPRAPAQPAPAAQQQPAAPSSPAAAAASPTQDDGAPTNPNGTAIPG